MMLAQAQGEIQEPLRPRLTEHLNRPFPAFDAARPHVIGVLNGEGVGPEVVPVALDLLKILEAHSSRRMELLTGSEIGYPAKAICGSSLSPDVIDFSAEIFSQQGALFCGPGGERFVYELRREFDLYCKFTPIEPFPELAEAGNVRQRALAETDMIAVRENMGGIYQGTWERHQASTGPPLGTVSPIRRTWLSTYCRLRPAWQRPGGGGCILS